MTTKNVPNTPGQTGLAATDPGGLPPGPGKMQPPGRSSGARDFSAVIDQAASNKPGTPKHVRSTKSNARGRRTDASTPPQAETGATSARDARSRMRPTRGSESSEQPSAPTRPQRPGTAKETQANTPASQLRDNTRTADSASNETPEPNTTTPAETEIAEPKLDASEINAEDSAEPSEASNIVPFPGMATAVIIPFPVAAAPTVPATTSDEFAPTTGESTLETITRPVPSRDTGSPIALTPPAETPATGEKMHVEPGSQTDRTGPDISALGLKPVTNAETVKETPIATDASSPDTASASSDARIIPVVFDSNRNTSHARQSLEPGTTLQTQLPGGDDEPEETARQHLDTPASASSAKIVLLRTDAAKAPPVTAENETPLAGPRAPEPGGISSARQDDRMELTTASEHAAASSNGESTAYEAQSGFTSSLRTGRHEAPESSDRTKVATDWQSSRATNAADRATLDVPVQESPSPSTSVERISNLVMREATLVRKYGSDSMAVVLRPDAETELFVHLTHREGRVEASVRCERGDAQHLSALWPQLQESLAQQKVRLAPLEESATARGNTNFQPPAGSLMNGGGERGTREDARPSQQQSMDEWPATPAPATAAPHVRDGRGTRGRRISTSRPGWETWA